MKKLALLLALLLLMLVDVTSAQEQTVITGTLLGSDNKPLAKSGLHITASLESSDQQENAEIGSDGKFKVTTARTGLFFVKFDGINHYAKVVKVMTGKPTIVDMDVKLSSYRYKPQFSDVGIIGNFNGFDAQKPLPMTKQADGTFVAEFETKLDKIEYQLLNVEERLAINGTQSENYRYDQSLGGYLSIVTPKDGKAKIIFDPEKVVRSKEKEQLTFKDPHSTTARVNAIFEEMVARDRAYNEAMIANEEAGKTYGEFLYTYDQTDDLEKVAQQIAKEKDPLVRQVLYLAYFSVHSKKSTTQMAQKALAEIPPTSLLWNIPPQNLGNIIYVALKDSKNSDKYDNYVDQVINSNLPLNVRGQVIAILMLDANEKNQTDKVKKYIDKLSAEEFKGTPFPSYISRTIPDKIIKVGNDVPDFSFQSLDNDQKTYSRENMKGKIYLIDFWATWCGPCIGEMDALHKVYEKFKDKNFEIISISFDLATDEVVKFRQGKWKMPWANSIIEDGFSSEPMKPFEIHGIPRPILVDTNGKIIALQEDLRGEKMEETISRFLNATK